MTADIIDINRDYRTDSDCRAALLPLAPPAALGPPVSLSFVHSLISFGWKRQQQN